MATVAPRLFDMSSGGAANASRAEGSGTHTEDGLDPVNIGTIKIGTDPIDYPSDANGSSRSSSEQQSPSGDEKSTSPPLAVSTASITLNLPTQTNSVPSTSDFQPSTSASVLPSPSSKRQSRQIAAYFDDQHIYANVREMEEVNSRPVPSAPSPDAVPTRDLKNGWLEFENELGRTFFYNVDTGKTQWIPPRFLRTPAEVQAMLKARGELMDFVCSTSSSAPVEQKHGDHLQANPHQTENGQQPKVEERKQEEIFDEPAEEPSDQEDHLHEDDGRFDDDNESEQFDEPAEDEEGFYQQAPPLPIKKNSGEFNNSGSPLMTSFMASNSQTDNFASSLMQPSTSDRPIQGEANRRENHRHSSPQENAASRSLSFNNRPKHVLVPQVQPTTSGNGTCFGSVPTPIYNHEYAVPPPCPNSDCKPIPTSMMHSYSHTLDRPPFHRGDQQRSVDSKSSIENERRCSSESREPVRTIRSGNMERCEWNETNKGRKREWIHGFVYLTSAHFILYKDERSAEKHGKHYDAPLCVWDLKGATISWNVEKDKKKRKVIQLELCNACRYLLRTSNDNETQEWFEALRDVIARLPPPTHQEIQSAILDSNSCSVMRNPSLVSHTPRPVSAASTVIV
ncbi:hypothetical protein WR25_20274 [Diploscapter pachys]|uniref:PH domain-containing protein n=1 Tax=Diploscapter pachys TaxID=2018661 RepID=A0A2A2LPF7_9BILA|nr:hypothetical protein WR25_20274 [Diploscapter pachys]